jgi:hypothetical protein
MLPSTVLDMGHLSRRAHQRVISRLLTGLYLLYETKQILIEPLPETDLDQDNPQSPCPDLILTDNEKYETPIIIEIAHSLGIKNDIKKIRKIIDETEFGVQEGFAYNYQTFEWHKYTKQNGLQILNPSFSEILQIDLNQFLS